MLADGYEFVIDLDKSSGCHFHDSKSGRDILDMFSCFASLPLGWNHPDLVAAKDELARASVNKVANSDLYTEAMAEAVDAFGTIAAPSYLPQHFFVSGGALAVENTMKAAMDWKSHQCEAKGMYTSGGFDWEDDHQKSSQLTIGHLREAFHGRSGYTLSVTNTDPTKTARFAKFDWPRFDNPKVNFPLNDSENARLDACETSTLDSIRSHAESNPDTMAAIIMEPIQGEGGDNHFRDSFLRDMRSVCDEVDALLIFDEIQTGMGATGRMWAHQHADVEPDMIAFGKKSQVCGLMASTRLKEFDDNVFEVSSRINSTFGGNLTDFVRARLILEAIQRDELVRNAELVGTELMTGLGELDDAHEIVSNVRGRGLFAAFTLPSTELRNKFNSICLDSGMHVLNSGTHSIRLRPSLTFSSDEVGEALNILESVANSIESTVVA